MAGIKLLDKIKVANYLMFIKENYQHLCCPIDEFSKIWKKGDSSINLMWECYPILLRFTHETRRNYVVAGKFLETIQYIKI